MDGDARNPNRRKLLQCMAVAGAGTLWTFSGGVPSPFRLGLGGAAQAAPAAGDFSFLQISDSHIGFHGDANPDSGATLQQALAHIGQLPQRPAMILHTGDVSHTSKDEQFAAAEDMLKTPGLDVHYVPGEHDTIGDNGAAFFARFTKGVKTGGWYSFDQGGVHFIALVNVLNLKANGLGQIGHEQLEWLEKDLKGRSASTPLVVYAHMPLWPVYPDWGWGTEDSAKAFATMKRFGSVTVLNGHIHQVVQKVEGHLSFHTAMSTAYPQPAPGQGSGPGPLKLPAEQLGAALGIRSLDYRPEQHSVVISDRNLAT
jgi:3',5'-cyclic-AMP phosphodiesterase